MNQEHPVTLRRCAHITKFTSQEMHKEFPCREETETMETVKTQKGIACPLFQSLASNYP